MVIDKVELTDERKEKLSEDGKAKSEEERYEELMEDFNKEAIKIKSPYRLVIERKYPKLISSTRGFIFSKTIEYTDIFFREKDTFNKKEYFYFYNGLDLNVFKDIEEILNKLDGYNFNIELKSGEVPTRYKIIEELEK